MPIGGKGVTEPPKLFLVIMIIAGIVFLLGGLRRWPLFLESGRLPELMSRLFVLSTEERNDYVAIFYIIGGLVLIATGSALFVFFYR
jgi:hypothetical protein